MKVSIITPVYNAGRFLDFTAESVFSQTYADWEWILVDDNSSDESWLIMEELARKDSRVKIFANETNMKAGYTRNFALDQSVGKYIAFLDADDIWHIDKLKLQVSFMRNNNYSFSHTSYGYLDEYGSKIKDTLHVSNCVDYRGLLKRTEISCLTAMYDAEVIGKHYMSQHARKQDYALWLSILKTGVNSYGLDHELAYYRQVEGSATSKKYKLVFKHISFLKDTQGFNNFQALYYTFFWMANGFYRYYVK